MAHPYHLDQRAALDAIEAQRAAYEETIRQMAEGTYAGLAARGSADICNPGWRADCEQRKQETIDAVKATANEQVPYNVQGVCTLHILLTISAYVSLLVFGRVQPFLGDRGPHAAQRSGQASRGQEKPRIVSTHLDTWCTILTNPTS